MDVCLNRNHKSYKLYGGSGATICERWLTYDNFREDMGVVSDDHTRVTRYDETMPYCKENCSYERGKSGSRLGSKHQKHNKKKKHYEEPVRVLLTMEKKLLDKIRQKSLQLSVSEHRRVTVPTLIQHCLLEFFPMPKKLDFLENMA